MHASNADIFGTSVRRSSWYTVYPMYGHGRDIFLVVWKSFLYILSHPYENPSFKRIPDYIQLYYEPILGILEAEKLQKAKCT